ncbi:MAG: hypothetical protein ACOCWA_09480, partial [Bacteroidota bacterium]
MENLTKDINEIRISDLTVFTIEKTKNDLDKFLQKDNQTRVVFENISAIDLSYIQLIYSLKKSKKADKIIFS